MKSLLSHFASGRNIRIGLFASAAVGVATYCYLPDDFVSRLASVEKNLWTVLGPLAAFAIQILSHLIAVGEDRLLSLREQDALSGLVVQRIRYLWDLVGIAILAMFVCVVAGTFDSPSKAARWFAVLGLSLVLLTSFVVARVPAMFSEIRQLRWRLARERNDALNRESQLSAISKATDDPKSPEPRLLKGAR